MCLGAPRAALPAQRAAVRPSAAVGIAERPYNGRRPVSKTYRLWAANRILIPTEDEPVDEIASLLVQRPLELAEESWASVLRSHGMDHEMTALFADGKVVDFLEARQAMLRDDLRRFLQRMCEWGFEDTPSLSELVVEDLDGEDLDIEGDDETR